MDIQRRGKTGERHSWAAASTLMTLINRENTELGCSL
jgi:hypothetical protein